ncbi:MAG: hypothetical protein V4562_12355 [Pseudomonadota bacterium]
MRRLTSAFALCAFLAACGGGGGSSGGGTGAPAPSPTPAPSPPAPAPVPGIGSGTVSGKITFDFVPVAVSGGTPRLDYGSTARRPARSVVVEAVDSTTQAVVVSTSTNASGDYSLVVPNGRTVYIRAMAKMLRSGSNTADFSVIDNTNQGAQWAIVGAPFSTGGAATQNLNAPSGWTGTAYNDAQRAAGPFAILDTVYQATQRIISVDSGISFPQLFINWSPNNVASGGDISQGQIRTSFFLTSNNNGVITRNLYILGRANSDTDEYDAHVVAHEFGHYLQDAFSRDDTLGGAHGGVNDRLDMRVAFSEGWGNGWSAIALNNPIYSDTGGANQASGGTFDVRLGEPSNAGWFKESSVERIFWDLSGSTAVGFGRVWATMRAGLTRTPALSSIHSYAHALSTGGSNGIAAILGTQNIVLPSTPYAENETNFGSPMIANLSPIYLSYGALGSTLANVCVSNAADPGRAYNKAGEFRYIRMTLPAGSRSFTMARAGLVLVATDPDMVLYNSAGQVATADSNTANSETFTRTLPAGDYVLAVTDFNLSNAAASSPCFTVRVD